MLTIKNNNLKKNVTFDTNKNIIYNLDDEDYDRIFNSITKLEELQFKKEYLEELDTSGNYFLEKKKKINDYRKNILFNINNTNYIRELIFDIVDEIFKFDDKDNIIIIKKKPKFSFDMLK